MNERRKWAVLLCPAAVIAVTLQTGVSSMWYKLRKQLGNLYFIPVTELPFLRFIFIVS